ncbi:MAG: hypothetical protein QNK37_29355 [Acidobacteriota bacterium]|nr:hypothetical protein [Acidobacteriota bacterium]
MRWSFVYCLLIFGIVTSGFAGEESRRVEAVFAPEKNGLTVGFKVAEGGVRYYGRLRLSQRLIDGMVGTGFQAGFSRKGRTANGRLSWIFSGDYQKKSWQVDKVNLNHKVSGKLGKFKLNHHLAYHSGGDGKDLDGNLTAAGKVGRVAVKHKLSYRFSESLKINNLTLSLRRPVDKHLTADLKAVHSPDQNTTRCDLGLKLNKPGFKVVLKAGRHSRKGTSLNLSVNMKLRAGR